MEVTNFDVCIVGAGISGLAVASFLQKQQPRAQMLVLEQEAYAGGAIRSYNESGFQAEWGPHGFLDNCGESKELIEIAGLTHEVTLAPLGSFVRYICLHGKLQQIPQKPFKILASSLVNPVDKCRVLADLWKSPLPGTPTVAEWISHRFGTALLPFADAVFTGTYAGDIERLLIDGVMPGLREKEQQHGSVIRGLIQHMRGRKKVPGTKPQLPAMTSFTNGMGMLPQALATRLHDAGILYYNQGVTAIEQQEPGWLVKTANKTIHCNQLILALPINATLPLLTALFPHQPPPCTTVPEAKIISVLLGFSRTESSIPFGFGYLAPAQEQRFALGALFSSHMFPGRAPEEMHLVEALVGGRRHPERTALSDEELIVEVKKDLGQLLQLSRPCFSRVLRPSSGIPQFENGYTDLRRWRQQIHDNHADLHLTGFGWKGIGINDMTKEAKLIAERVLHNPQHLDQEEIKGVYF